MTTTETVLVKATPLMSVLAFMEENLPAQKNEAVLASLAEEFPEEVRKVRSKRILATERYPVMFLNRLIEGSAQALGEDPAAVGHRIGRRGAENAAGGILRLALIMVSMESLLRKLQPVWSQLYSHGRTSYELRDRNATIELHEFPIVSATQCARVTGMLEWFAEKAEKTATLRHTSCRARGELTCRWELRW